MKKTVADLMGPQVGSYSGDAMRLMRESTGSEKPESPTERLFTVSLVLDPSEVEIIDQKLVIEKRVISRSRREALEKCGFTITG